MNDLLKPFLLEGRVALVTGASSGFGRHFGSVLAAAGAKVVLAARRTERVQEACETIARAGGEAIAVTMDVTDSTSVRAAFEASEQAFGVVTVVVNNAGISIPKPLVDLSDSDWTDVIDTNLNGLAYVTRESAQRMIAAGVGGSHALRPESQTTKRIAQGQGGDKAHVAHVGILQQSRHAADHIACCTGLVRREIADLHNALAPGLGARAPTDLHLDGVVQIGLEKQRLAGSEPQSQRSLDASADILEDQKMGKEPRERGAECAVVALGNEGLGLMAARMVRLDPTRPSDARGA